MAAHIESMFYRGETPWHGLGQIVSGALTMEEAIKKAGLDWKVGTKPIFLQDGTPLETGKAMGRYMPQGISPVTGERFPDKFEELATVGNRYEPLQNVEQFNFFNPFVESGMVELETAGSLMGGKKIFVLGRIKQDSELRIVGDDVIRKYILLSNSHDGTAAIRCGFTPIRVVCANTLAMAHHNGESQLIRVRHTKSAVANLDSLRDTMNLANQSFEATAEQYRQLARRQINKVDLVKYVKTVLGQGDIKNEDMSTRAQNQVMDIISRYEAGLGSDIVGVRGTVWAAYNAVTEYLTHEASNNANQRYQSLWFGQNRLRNDLALGEAIKLAA